MGMFDSVFVACRNKDCDNVIEFQSKMGDCILKSYSIDDVPIAIAKDISGERMCCEKCQYENEIRITGYVPETIKMKVI